MAARAWTRAGLVLAAVLLADQLTKAWVRADVAVGHEDSVFPALTLVHVKNEGVAFSVFEGRMTVILVIIAIAVTALVVYFATHATRPLIWLPTGLLVGGAAGNVVDRIRDGAVTDFLKLPLWPAFNVADIAVTFGVLALLYVVEREASPDGTHSTS